MAVHFQWVDEPRPNWEPSANFRFSGRETTQGLLEVNFSKVVQAYGCHCVEYLFMGKSAIWILGIALALGQRG
jgi:hypothetical protein